MSAQKLCRYNHLVLTRFYFSDLLHLRFAIMIADVKHSRRTWLTSDVALCAW